VCMWVREACRESCNAALALASRLRALDGNDYSGITPAPPNEAASRDRAA
jgi:hypothetical protein